MKYFLGLPFLEPTPEIDITEEDFLNLSVARNNMSDAFSIEDKYEMLISNYLDFEKEILQITLRNSIIKTNTYLDFYNMLSNSSIKFVNFLSVASHYLDQLPRNFSESLGGIDFSKKIISKRAEEYDKCFEYRFMQALRNHALHYPMLNLYLQPITLRTSTDSSGLIENSSKLIIKKSQLIKNEKFKSSVIDEMPDEVNLIHLTRKYIECISTINQLVRDTASIQLSNDRKLILKMHDRYSALYNNNTNCLTAYEVKDTKIVSEVTLNIEWDDIRIQLEKKNPQLINQSKLYVTSSPK